MTDQDKAIRSALLTARPAVRQLNGSNMYSQAAEAAQALPQAKGQPQQMLASLKGVKPEEVANSGAAQAFAGQPSVTREQLAQHFQKSAPQVRETNLGNYHEDEDGDKPKFEEYTIPGGENYRELLMHAPTARRTPEDFEKTQHLAALQLLGYQNLSNWHRRNGADPNPADPEYARLNEEATQSQRAYHEAMQEPKRDDFKSSHWDTPNVLAHLRMSDRMVPNGKTPEPDQKIFDETLPGTPERRARLAEQDRAKKGDKVLHLEELQSDWGQAGREKGFKEPVSPELEAKAMGVANDSLLPNRKYLPGFADKGIVTREDIRALRPEQISFWEKTGAVSPEQAAVLKEHEEAVSKEHTGVPKGPYVTSTNGWTDLGLKRALTEAARGKYDRLAWTPGQEQGERYGLAKKLSHLAYHPEVHRLLGTEHGASHAAIEENDVTPEKLPSYVGKELAERLLASEKDANGAHSVAGDDLKVGGEGMKGYYDKILPSRLKEILKKLGHEAKFEPLTIKHPKDDAGRTEHTLHSVPLPPELREKILKGLPAYAAGGTVLAPDDPQRAANLQRHMEGSKTPHVLYHGTHGDIHAFKRTTGAHFGFHFGDQEAANNRLEDTADKRKWDPEDIKERDRIAEGHFNKLMAYENEFQKRDAPFTHEDAAKHGDDIDALLRDIESRRYKPTPEEETERARLRAVYEASKYPIIKTGEGANIGAYHVAIKNPLKMQDVGNWGSLKAIKQHLPFDSDAKTHAELAEHLQQRGYDGVVYPNRVENPVMKTNSYIAFNPSQIKSATGNSGHYDPENPSIVRERGGSIIDHALRLTAPPAKAYKA